MALDREQHMVALVDRDKDKILDVLKMSFRRGNGNRQIQLDYLDMKAEELGYNLTDFDPALFMKNETIRDGLVALLASRHGNSPAFNQVEDAVDFIQNDLETTFSRDRAKW